MFIQRKMPIRSRSNRVKFISKCNIFYKIKQPDFQGNNNNNNNNKMNQPNFYNNQPIEQVAIKKLPNPQNYKIVKCKNFDNTGKKKQII